MLTMLRQGRTLCAQGILVLALLAAGIQASLPQGYMLDRDAASGGVSVVFCTGHGAEQRWLDLATGEVREGGAPAPADSGRDQPCAFAMASAAVGPLPHVPAFLPPAPASADNMVLADAALPAGHRRNNPPVRAPPASL
ncbi:hypothetical protein [Maricaulis sp.]|uniref:hypothetical protein n=1 Tax=Maricaulis sp. TaxID=1486257 RepID=UPI003A943D6A